MSENGFPVAPGTGNQEGSNLPTTTDASEASSSELESTDTGTAVNTSLPEKHSAIKSFFKDGEMVRRLVILVFLVIFVAGIIFAVISFTSTSTKAPDTERKLGQYSSAEIPPWSIKQRSLGQAGDRCSLVGSTPTLPSATWLKADSRLALSNVPTAWTIFFRK